MTLSSNRRGGRFGPRGLLAGILACAFATACGPTDYDGSGDFPVRPGGLVRTPTAPGRPVAPPATRVISPYGGTFSTEDGALTVTIPAGAVAAAEEFTITPIANTARGAIGGAFRLGPEGLTFDSPVRLTFRTPERYPAGATIAGVGVETQDEEGYWHPVEVVVRDAAARTITVETTHFSDWALTWQLGTATMEGPILLTQTVGIPFTATGTATAYFQADTSTDTIYLLTGTLTVPDSITVGDETCVPDQATKTLPPNVAELHKSEPPVFRWGLGVNWFLTCTGPGGAVTERLMPAMFDTMYINLTRCGGYYEPGQIAEPDHVQGAYTSDCGAEGVVSASWDLRGCVAGLPCYAGECRAGVTACADGVQSCVDAGPEPDGTPCGPGGEQVCSAGACLDPEP